MLDVVTTVQEELTLTVEFDRFRRLVDAVSPLKVLLGTLRKLSLCSVDDLVQVVHLAELSLRVSSHDGTLVRSKQESGTGTRCEGSCLRSTHREVTKHHFYLRLGLIN